MASLYGLRSLLVYEEPAGQFAVDHSGTPGDFLPVAFQPGTLTADLQRPSLATNIAQQYKHAKSERVHGPRAVSLGFSMPLHGSGLSGNASVANADEDTNALMRILKAVFGGIRGGNMGSTVAAAPTSGSIFSVASGHGTRFTAGGAMGWTNAAGNLEIRPIESVTTDAIVLKYGFSATPAEDDPLYNATTIYLDDSGTHLQFIARGAAPTDRWSLRGLQLASLAINNPLGELPTLAFTFQGAEWENLLSGSLAAVTYSNTRPIGFNGGKLMVQPVGTATAADVPAPEVTVTPSLTYIAERGPGGTNTVFGYTQAHSEEGVVAGSFRTYYTDQGWFDAAANSTRQAFALQIGQINARGCLIEVPNIQIGSVQGPQDLNQFSGLLVPWDGSIDIDATDQSTAERRSAFRIHMVG